MYSSRYTEVSMCSIFFRHFVCVLMCFSQAKQIVSVFLLVAKCHSLCGLKTLVLCHVETICRNKNINEDVQHENALRSLLSGISR